MKKKIFTLATIATLGALAAFVPSRAHAGGFEVPDNGTEALGRGGAFTAKADDATALQYNVAGFARQRGTRLLLNANLTLDDYSFQRAGTFPDNASDARTPWGGAFYPKVKNQGGPFFAPFIGASTDFGYFDRFTIAAGVFGPSGVGNRTYPLGVSGAPSAARYDVVQAKTFVALPTLAFAYRVTDEIDLGVGLHAVIASFDLTSVSSTDISRALCPTVEYVGCDAQTRVQTTAFTYAGSLGAMWHPSPSFAMGLNVRSPITIDSEGTANASAPAVTPTTVSPAPAQFHTKLPLVVRGGARVVFWEEAEGADGAKRAFERADLEVDATYEAWSSAQGDGSRVDIPQLNLFKDIHTTIAHKFGDTYSVRLGGQYNFEALGSVMSLRAGGYYDATATSAAYTRMDFNTLDKYAATVGVGFHVGGLRFNVAYAEVFSPERIVTDGQVRPINGSQKGQPIDGAGKLLPAVNNGVYDAHMRIVSFGMQVVFDEVLGNKRNASAPPVTEPRVTEPRHDDVEHGEPEEEEAKAAPAPRDPRAAKPMISALPKRETRGESSEQPSATPAAKPAAKPKKSDWND
jgi:long-chain fatty acid transport protein